MAFKLLAMAERRWRRITAPELAGLLADGTLFVDGIQQKDGQEEEERKDAA